MSANAQELRNQIAEIRAQMKSARAAARTGKVISILGVLIGIGIVAIFVLKFVGLAKKTVNPSLLIPVVQTRVEQIDLVGVAKNTVNEAMPILIDEVKKMAKDLGVAEAVGAEARIALEQILPVFRNELERARPKIEDILRAQKDKTLSELSQLLEQKMSGHLAGIVRNQTGRLAETGFDEETLNQVVANLELATLEAFKEVMEKRKGDLETQLAEIGDMMMEIPALEPMSREQIATEMVHVLVSLLKHKLPDYYEGARGKVGAAPVEIQAPMPSLPSPEEVRRKAQESAARAKAAAEAAKEGQQ